ncbi:hypothetical protein [Paenibacillus thalictri]|uniref:Uncharacterized protein n=1 Tax=Paenibacillus thalictri TaxID=2527873 RepID=A0A4Q9DFV5_9BACL|nr:hypothetical protein [Paenibacillus thalictri]TBL71035.1 hypothetical protein EYB31_31310 [Paenibacillus thalictri]
MTQEQQHQMPERHAIDNAEKAISMAQYAEQEIERAREASDPHKLQAALGKLQTAQREVREAQEQLSAQEDGHHHQELVQVEEQTVSALQNIDSAEDESLQPKQVR